MGKHRNQPAGRKPGDGKLGYKNIDKAHQWKKGCPSPNPAGRRTKKPVSETEEFYETLVRILKESLPTGDRELPVREVVLRRFVGGAVNDPKMAIKILPQIIHMLMMLEPKVKEVDGRASDEDAALLDDALRRLGRGGRYD